MLHEYDHATVEIGGQDYTACVRYETHDGDVEVYAVQALKQVAKRGEYWYGKDGNGRCGPHYITVDVTEFVDLAYYKTQVERHLERFLEVA